MMMTAAKGPTSARTERATELMLRFADRTGLIATSSTPSEPRQEARRYLWTDAFAVATFVGLANSSGSDSASMCDLALRLIDRVHHELGRHRVDDSRTGWLSGLPNEEAELHPTIGGLRIGKSLPERSKTDAYDPELEWHRDGQYFHYLSKWMHALDLMSRCPSSTSQSLSTEQRATFHRWAHELAMTAHNKFTYGPIGDRRMWWKMSIDLSRPLVRSMGQHDPLDGLVTCAQIAQLATTEQRVDLAMAMTDFAEIVAAGSIETSDPLGIGGLLVDAYRLAQLGVFEELTLSLLATAASGLRTYVRTGELRAASHRRLAFRELGLAIGLASVPLLQQHFAEGDKRTATLFAELETHLPVRSEIESFWLQADHRSEAAWIAHEDINDVMLAASLEPDGFLSLQRPPPATTSSLLKAQTEQEQEHDGTLMSRGWHG